MCSFRCQLLCVHASEACQLACMKLIEMMKEIISNYDFCPNHSQFARCTRLELIFFHIFAIQTVKNVLNSVLFAFFKHGGKKWSSVATGQWAYVQPAFYAILGSDQLIFMGGGHLF